MKLLGPAVGVMLCSSAFAGASTPAFTRASQLPAPAAISQIQSPEGCGALLLSQTTSAAVLPGNSSNCNFDGVVHAENSYYRAFDLAAFTAGFDLCAVDFGVERAVAGSVSQPVIINVYSSSGAAFPDGTLSLLGTQTINLADQAASMVSVPISGHVDAGKEMVLEVRTPSGLAASNSFFIGSNNLGESRSGFIRAPDCGVVDPMTTVDSGFPDMNILINARGDAAVGTAVIEVEPAPVDFGAIVIGATEPGSVDVVNRGNDVLRIDAISIPPLPFALEDDDCTGQFIAVGGRCTMSYSFSPLAESAFQAVLSINSNAAPVPLELVGSGFLAAPIPSWDRYARFALILLITGFALRRISATRLRGR